MVRIAVLVQYPGLVAARVAKDPVAAAPPVVAPEEINRIGLYG